VRINFLNILMLLITWIWPWIPKETEYLDYLWQFGRSYFYKAGKENKLL
jgi:hypothetical protein